MQCRRAGHDRDAPSLVEQWWEELSAKLMSFIENLALEYGVPLKKIHYSHFRLGKQFPESSLKVPASWKEPATLERAWEGFDALRTKNRK